MVKGHSLVIVRANPQPRVTTNIAEDCRAILKLRGWPMGTTLNDFYLACIDAGMPPDAPLASIEVGISQFPTGRILVEQDEHGAYEIREARQ